MKKVVTVLGLLSLILLVSLTAGASSFEADGSYLFGKGEKGTIKTESRGFAVHAAVEIVPYVVVDGSFLSTNVTKLEGAELPEGSSIREQLMAAGGLYRVVSEPDLQVVVGAGFLELSTKETGAVDLKGRGIYGKIGFKSTALPKVTLLADLSFAPKYKVGEESANFISARATISYQMVHDLGLQATIKHYKASTAETKTNTLIGGGVVLSF